MVIKKSEQQLKYLHLFFGGFPLNFDKEKWYYMYIEKFLKNDVFLVFCHNFVTPILNLVLSMCDLFVVTRH